MRTARRLVPLRFHARMLADVDAEAARQGLTRQAFVLACVSYALRRGERAHLFRELHLTPGEGQEIESMLEWLAARRPVLSDLAAEGSSFNGPLRKVMLKVLGEKQLRRLEHVAIRGLTLEEVGHAEGVSRQAIHASNIAACAKLAASAEFTHALCAMFPDSGLTPGMLARAREVRHGAA